jgi:hypothetical protein
MQVQWRDPHMSARKWLKASFVVLSMSVLVYVVARPTLHSYLITHPRRSQSELTQEQTGLPVERVAFQATDGVELSGWFVAGGGDGGTIVVSHGLGASGAASYPGYAFLSRAGYNLLLIDHRAHGHSGGHASSLGPMSTRTGSAPLAARWERASCSGPQRVSQACVRWWPSRYMPNWARCGTALGGSAFAAHRFPGRGERRCAGPLGCGPASGPLPLRQSTRSLRSALAHCCLSTASATTRPAPSPMHSACMLRQASPRNYGSCRVPGTVVRTRCNQKPTSRASQPSLHVP